LTQREEKGGGNDCTLTVGCIYARVESDLARRCEANTFTSSMRSVFLELFKQYEDPANVDKLRKVQRQVEQVAEVERSVIDSVLGRGVKVEALNAKTENLVIHASKFEHTSVDLERRMRCRALKIKLLVFGAVLAVLIILALVIWAATV
jgi:hypothetical protein